MELFKPLILILPSLLEHVVGEVKVPLEIAFNVGTVNVILSDIGFVLHPFKDPKNSVYSPAPNPDNVITPVEDEVALIVFFVPFFV